MRNEKDLFDSFDSALRNVTTVKNENIKKANEVYADAFYDVVQKALKCVTALGKITYINFYNEKLGAFIRMDSNKDLYDTSTVEMSKTGLKIVLKYNYYDNRHKPGYSDKLFDIEVINKLLEPCNIKVVDTCGEYGSQDYFIITFSRRKKVKQASAETQAKQKAKIKK